MSTALVVCIGNPMVSDDSVGPAIYEELKKKPLPPGVRLELVAVGGLRLLDLVDGEDLLVVVDAVCTGAPAGTVLVRDWGEIAGAVGLPVTSHDVGLREAVEVGRLLQPESMPGRIVLVGIEGECFDRCDLPMTTRVSAAIGEALAEVAGLLGSPNDPEVGAAAVEVTGAAT